MQRYQKSNIVRETGLHDGLGLKSVLLQDFMTSAPKVFESEISSEMYTPFEFHEWESLAK